MRKNLSTNDFIFTAYMLGFKEILNECFRQQGITFGQAIKEVTSSMPHGVFTNTIILEITQRVGVPLERVINFILPGPIKRFPSLADNLTKLESRYSLMKKPVDLRQLTGRQRILPMIRSNGTLVLIQKSID